MAKNKSPRDYIGTSTSGDSNSATGKAGSGTSLQERLQNISGAVSSSNQSTSESPSASAGQVAPNAIDSQVTPQNPKLLLSKENVAGIEAYIHHVVQAANSDGARRARYEYVDRLLQRELDQTEKAVKSKLAYYSGEIDKIPDVELPLGFMQFDAAHAWLASVFSSGYPMFSATATPELGMQASQMNALIAKDQNHFGWMREINKTLAAALRYNVGASEVQWENQVVNTAVNFTPASAESYAQSEPQPANAVSSRKDSIVYSGNSIRAMDMYNTFWDTTCDVNRVHELGAFAGYIENVNYIQLKQFVNSLNSMFLIGASLKTIFSGRASPAATTQFFSPSIDPFRRNLDNKVTGNNVNWDVYFGVNSKNKTTNSTGFEKITFYGRIIPVEFGIKIPRNGAPQVWKFVTINGTLLYAEPIISGHNYLPIVFTQLYDYDIGTQAKSFVEGVAPFQHLGTAIVKGMTAAMRRSVADRIFYNPAVFDATDIKSTAPDARIPVKLNRYIQNFDSAFRQVDFRDTLTPAFRQNLDVVMGLTNQINGVNQAQQGNFVKGNKTLEEFSTIMSKADGRLQLLAMNLESSLFYPIKQIIKLNYLLYATDELLYDPVNNVMVQIAPDQLRQRSPEFAMADGLIPLTKLGSTQVLMMAIQLFGQIPELAMQWDIAAIAVEALRQQGFTNIDKFKRSQEQMQQYISQMQAMNSQTQQQQQPQQQPQQ